MRKVILKISVWLDGFIGGSGEVEWVFPSLHEGTMATSRYHNPGTRSYTGSQALWH